MTSLIWRNYRNKALATCIMGETIDFGVRLLVSIDTRGDEPQYLFMHMHTPTDIAWMEIVSL